MDNSTKKLVGSSGFEPLTRPVRHRNALTPELTRDEHFYREAAFLRFKPAFARVGVGAGPKCFTVDHR